MMQANDVIRAALETIRPFVQQQALAATETGDRAAALTQRIWNVLGAAAPADPHLVYPLTVFRSEPDDQRNLERLAAALAVHLAGQADVLAELYGLTAQLQWLAQQAGVTITLTNAGTNSGQQVGANSGAVIQQNDQSGPRGGVNFGSGGQFGDISIGDVAGRDIIRTDITQGDRISTGDVSGTGIAIGRNARSTVRNINTGGGDYAEGNIDKRTGSFTGGQGGASERISSTLRTLRETLAAAPHGDPAVKAELDQVLGELGAVLLQTPAAHGTAAEALTELTQTLITQALKPQPNQVLVQVTAGMLIQTAQTLAAALPAVLPIAQRLVNAVFAAVGVQVRDRPGSS